MTDITPDKTPEEDPRHIPTPESRREGESKPKIPESGDARDPSLVPPRPVQKKPTVKPADEQEVEAEEVKKGLDWADDDKRTVDRRSYPPE